MSFASALGMEWVLCPTSANFGFDLVKMLCKNRRQSNGKTKLEVLAVTSVHESREKNKTVGGKKPKRIRNTTHCLVLNAPIFNLFPLSFIVSVFCLYSSKTTGLLLELHNWGGVLNTWVIMSSHSKASEDLFHITLLLYLLSSVLLIFLSYTISS